MFDIQIISILPLFILAINYYEVNLYISMLVPVMLILLNDKVIMTLITIPTDGTLSIIHRLKNVVFCVVMFIRLKDYEHHVEDLINNYYYLPILGLIYFIPRYSQQEKHLEMDVIYRYFCIVYFKELFDLPTAYILSTLYYASTHGIDVRDHLLYSLIRYYFGVIPCVIIKLII